MSKITLEGRAHEIDGGETVLEGLLRDGVSVPHSCRNGICQSCLMRAVEGTPPEAAQKGLKEGLRI